MKIKCNCGNTILDITDALRYKAHYIPEVNWDEIMEKIECYIKEGNQDKEKLCWDMRKTIIEKTRLIYQCNNCGKVYIEDEKRNLIEFNPLNNENTDVLKK